jgi:tight adherence protein B
MPAMLVMALLSLMVGLTYMALTGPSSSKRVARRLDDIRARHSTSQAAMAQAQMRRILANRDNQLDDFFKRFMPKPELMRQRLARTGKSWTLGKYGAMCAGLSLVAFILLEVRGAPVAMALAFSLLVGLGLPYFITGFLIKKRIADFNKRFPDAIDLLVRGLRSGLPISETMNVVAKEIPDPVGAEFRAVADKIRIGRTMEQALQETADKIGTAEIQFFVITLAIQRETGGNLAETLSNLSDVLRKRAQMKLKIKAMSSESKASAYIVGSLPFIVFGLIWMINPPYMAGFFTDQRLIVAGIGGLLWMGIGVFIMAKMVSFEI